jgi:hypothetical protein
MKALDLAGQRFNRLVAIKRYAENTKHGNRKWICKCDCGKEVIVCAGNLRSGHAVSCGCVRKPHGDSGSNLYNVWVGIKKRCLNPTNHNYKDYGMRGITVCEEWLQFIPFRDWALANGYNKGLQIDRKDVNGNYEPSNCRFVTCTANNQNKRTNVLTADNIVTIKKMIREGKHKQKDIGKMFGVRQSTISQIKNGTLWSSITEDNNESAKTSI